jgi:hypothetical protein
MRKLERLIGRVRPEPWASKWQAKIRALARQKWRNDEQPSTNEILLFIIDSGTVLGDRSLKVVYDLIRTFYVDFSTDVLDAIYAQSPRVAFECARWRPAANKAEMMDWVLDHFCLREHSSYVWHMLRYDMSLSSVEKVANRIPEAFHHAEIWSVRVRSRGVAEQFLLHGMGHKLDPRFLIKKVPELIPYLKEMRFGDYLRTQWSFSRSTTRAALAQGYSEQIRVVRPEDEELFNELDSPLFGGTLTRKQRRWSVDRLIKELLKIDDVREREQEAFRLAFYKSHKDRCTCITRYFDMGLGKAATQLTIHNADISLDQLKQMWGTDPRFLAYFALRVKHSSFTEEMVEWLIDNLDTHPRLLVQLFIVSKTMWTPRALLRAIDNVSSFLDYVSDWTLSGDGIEDIVIGLHKGHKLIPEPNRDEEYGRAVDLDGYLAVYYQKAPVFGRYINPWIVGFQEIELTEAYLDAQGPAYRAEYEYCRDFAAS